MTESVQVLTYVVVRSNQGYLGLGLFSECDWTNCGGGRGQSDSGIAMGSFLIEAWHIWRHDLFMFISLTY
jgi:hypothetical protein